MGVIARGVRGELWAGYVVAASLGRWALDIREDLLVDGRWIVNAEMIGGKGYWLNHATTFELRLEVGGHLWVWPGVEIERGADRLLVRGQGQPEVR